MAETSSLLSLSKEKSLLYCFHSFIFKPRGNSYFALIMILVSSKRGIALVFIIGKKKMRLFKMGRRGKRFFGLN